MNAPRKVVITGASRGLGRALAEGLAELGHLVIGCSRDARAMDQLARQLGAPHEFSMVDVSDDGQVGRWARSTIAKHGAPDLLLNNAALINRPQVLWEISPAEFSQLIDVNVKGAFHVIRHFAPAMIRRAAGVIVNFSSTWGRGAAPEVAPYCASKFAIEGMTAALAAELPPGLSAVAMNPGIINTDMLRTCFAEAASSHPTAQEWAVKAIPFLLDLSEDDNGDPLTAPT